VWSWVVRLGARPDGFDPPRHLALAGTLADALLRWMQEDDGRSRILVSLAADPAVQRFLDGFEAEVRDSGIARPMRGLAFAGRSALLWMGCSFFFGNRPQKILTGELLVRCGRADELARVAARFEPLWEAP
jgi:hypothetical protein